jgi:hypothetical protein
MGTSFVIMSNGKTLLLVPLNRQLPITARRLAAQADFSAIAAS